MAKNRPPKPPLDPRLGRRAHFDPRSRAYPVRETVAAAKPRSYTWSCGRHLDQGQEGACVGFACAHELLARPCVVKGVGSKAALDVYHEAQRVDPWPGGAYPGADPYYEGTSVLAGVQTLKALGLVGEYRWAFGLDDLVLAVGHKGPALLGVNWYTGMLDADDDGFVRVSGGLAGGHAILCKGVSVTTRTFTLHNSWGASWGRGGDCLVSWDDMEFLLDRDGEACVPLSRSKGAR